MKLCIYCNNDFATDLDHTIPYSFYSLDYKGGRKKASHNDPVPMVDSCKECNILLSNKLIPEINDRKKYLLNKYKSRYKKLLSTPYWDEDELEELDKDLRNKLIYDFKIKKWVEEKINFLSLTT